jgi:UDP-2,3-diacylglucosamine hydrolase
LRSEASLLKAPPDWRVIDFISDLHLQAAQPQTFDAWAHYLRTTRADAVFMLGDLFEAWVGDDVLPSTGAGAGAAFEARCVGVMRDFGSRRALFVMHGNRDFLMGQALMQRASATLLDDPSVLAFGGQRWLLSHGDALCLADTDYQAFRHTVRSAAWQQEFLAKPLAERQQIARHLRAQSQALQRTRLDAGHNPLQDYADVDSDAAAAWLGDAQATHLIHGHTHRPGDHPLGHVQGQALRRSVLTDWDLAAQPPRSGVLRLSLEGNANAGVQVSRIAASAA